MTKLPADHPIRREDPPPQRRNFRRDPRDWRGRADRAPSIVGRGDYRCGLCQEILDWESEDVVRYNGENCHSRCAESEEP
jgi:hypothetical protein